MTGVPATSSDGTATAGAADDVEMLVYDYLKHLTTLALVALGGILSIVQGKQTIQREPLIAVVLLIGAAGGCAVSGLDGIIRARIAGRPMPRSVRWYRIVASACFSIGVGAFLAIFLKVV